VLSNITTATHDDDDDDDDDAKLLLSLVITHKQAKLKVSDRRSAIIKKIEACA